MICNTLSDFLIYLNENIVGHSDSKINILGGSIYDQDFENSYIKVFYDDKLRTVILSFKKISFSDKLGMPHHMPLERLFAFNKCELQGEILIIENLAIKLGDKK